ncbi:MAG: PTS fructose transporter subunit IIA [Proteobacteria bacterium]|nr:PTS fructose transporter subunit IIA [Pseudomonadota bacterium]
MTNILVIAHGNLAEELVKIAETALDIKSSAVSLCYDLNTSFELLQQSIEQEIEKIDPDENILILTDLFGGTPSNLSIPHIKRDRVEVITGVNLAMMIYLLSQSGSKDFDQVCTGVKKAGRDAIVIAGEFLA